MNIENMCLYWLYLPQLIWSKCALQFMGLATPKIAPDYLAQSILPGCTFANVVNITEQNSSSPETEHEIVLEQSYGKQLGRLMDAVNDLIEERPKSARDKDSYKKLIEQHDSVDKIKKRLRPELIKNLEEKLSKLKDI